MSFGWSGIDPVQQNEGIGVNLELATRFVVNASIRITAIRVWAELSVDVTDRSARLWTSAGTLLATVDLPDTLPSGGWAEYTLATPVEVLADDVIDVAYSTTQYYGVQGEVAAGYPRFSSDEGVIASMGRYTTILGNQPSNQSLSFYGVDIVYTLLAAPSITGMSVSKADLDVIASVNITDETPSTVVIEWDWGDGTSESTGAGVTTADHTYSQAGLYAILATATDSAGLVDSASRAVSVSASLTTTATEEWIDDIFDAVVSDVQRSGYFDLVNMHEPKRAPGKGLTAAVWVQAIDPIALMSGLASTSARIVFMLRIYSNMFKEPQDMIDPEMMRATSNIMRRYHDDFDFEGVIRNIDLLGQFGVALAAQAGYLEVSGTHFRIMDITIPCLVNDVWPQVS